MYDDKKALWCSYTDANKARKICTDKPPTSFMMIHPENVTQRFNKLLKDFLRKF